MKDTNYQHSIGSLLVQVIMVGSIISLMMKIVIKKDQLFQVTAMGLTLSIIFCYLNRQQHEQRLHHSFFIYLIIIYLTIVGIATFIYLSYARLKNKTIKTQKLYINYIIMLFSGIYLVVSILSYCLYFNIFNIILTEDYIFICGLLVAGPLVLLFIVDKMLLSSQQQAIRRKLFHIGPILTIPFIYQLNPQLLNLVLSVGFYVFFILEYIRYHLQESNLNQKDEQLSIPKLLIALFKLMNKFNKDQEGFWFTHIFLILSLLFSYSIHPLLGNYKNIEHLVLIFIAADGFAALIGKPFGKIKIYQKKTLQGTLSFMVSFYIGYSMLISKQNEQSIASKVLITLICSCGQLFGGYADNIITILAFYAIKLIENHINI